MNLNIAGFSTPSTTTTHSSRDIIYVLLFKTYTIPGAVARYMELYLYRLRGYR